MLPPRNLSITIKPAEVKKTALQPVQAPVPPPWQIRNRGRFAAGSAGAGRKNLNLTAYETRFLIPPRVEAAHPASFPPGFNTRIISSYRKKVQGGVLKDRIEGIRKKTGKATNMQMCSRIAAHAVCGFERLRKS